MPSKGTQTIWKAGEWNEELESNVWSECSPENSAKHDNKGQSRNFAHKFVCSWLSDFTAPDFTVLSEVAAVTVPHRETTETFYKLSQIVCVRADSSDTRQLFIMACLQENVSVGMKRVKAKAFIQDPFNPVLFTEDAERYVDVSNIVYALTCYNFREDTLEVEEDDLILLLDVIHHTNEVLIVAEAAESVAMTETAVDEVNHVRIPRRRKRRFEMDFFYYE